MIQIENVDILGPTPDAIEALRVDFERSALDWLERASRAEVAGRKGEAAAAMAIASIAARVACGGRP